MTTKLAAKQNISGHRTVRECRIAGAIEARVCGHNPRGRGEPRRPEMSERRIKKLLWKLETGAPLGRAEARMDRFWRICSCIAVDEAMLRNAY
jgi:hypothetical protein